MKTWTAATILALVVLLAPSALAQGQVPDRISLLTMGPGDHPFARFGHNALLLEWRRGRRALVYNYGTFAFDGLQGVADFMAGRFRYWLSVSTLERTLGVYAAFNRSVVVQELALTRDERRTLASALEENALPENREYDYDYYRDNCSTRVRDAIDRVIGGAIRRQTQGAGRLTFREHTLRLTADGFWVYFGLDLALGPLTDRPTTRWDETFIPDELRGSLGRVTITRQGRTEPLVRSEATLVSADRPPERLRPPNRVPGFALAGLLIGAVFAALGRAGPNHRLARWGFSISTALLGLVLGLLGCVFLYFWGFTKHWSAFQNVNVLVSTPWSLALVTTAAGVIRRRPASVLRSHRLIIASCISAILALLIAMLPNFGQDNTRVAALFTPIWVGVYFGSAKLSGFPLWPSSLQRPRTPETGRGISPG